MTGITAFSQNPRTSCSGEYESITAPRSWASATARDSEPGLCTVSASVNSSQPPRAILAPADIALFFPVHPEGRGSASTTSTRGNDWAISRVLSVEASFTTMISKSTLVWAASDSRQVPRQASSFRAGTITDTVGLLATVSGAIIGRIRYYNFVRRASVGTAILALFVTLTGCYGGSRPP